LEATLKLTRLIKLYELLRGGGAFTALQICRQYGISRQQAYRDIWTLEAAGLPLVNDGGKWALIDPHR